MKQFQVKNINSGATFTVNQGESVLNAALRQGVMLPYSCKNGTCGSCKGRLESGDVHYPFHPPLALSREEIGEGFALLCQAEPTENLVIRAREIEAVRDIQIRKMPARVIEKTLLTADVMRLKIKLPDAQRLQFLAGQYLEILLSDGKRRAFSIASSPQSEDVIELHIRHVEGGGYTGWVFEKLKERDILRIEAPLGTFFIRNDQTDRPMILMGGGTWGVRNSTELYMHEQALQWAEQYDHIQYSCAFSEPLDEDADNGFKGFVHEAVLQQYPDLASFDIYMSGPPAMIDASRSAFLENGAEKRRIFFDSFEFGLDVPIRVLAKPH